MDDGALDDALEAGGRLGILGALGDQVVELGVDIGDEVALELVEIDVAGAHHGGGVVVVDQRQQQVLERRVFVVPLVGERERPVERLFEAAGECRHQDLMSSIPIRSFVPRRARDVILHFFSITHCRGCWCLRAKSITCVTLVSATS